MIDLTVVGIAVGAVLATLATVLFVVRRRPKMLNSAHYQGKWREAQNYCKDKTTWPLAIISADKLLDDALRRRRFKGGTMGERLVAAQRQLSDNDAVWYAHKLRNRLVHETADVKLKENEVKRALIGIRQALKDLGAQIK